MKNVLNYVKEDNQFYPTPKEVVKKMCQHLIHTYKQKRRDVGETIKCSKIDTYDISILEPSAGKGDLIDYLFRDEVDKDEVRHNVYLAKDAVDCVEIDPNLQSILIGKGYRVVHDDFLTFETQKRYNLIIMNPPFENAIKHFMKAFRLLNKANGHLICLMNAETIKNPYSKERKVFKNFLDEQNATIEFVEEGFKNADRKTEVESVIIYIEKKQKFEQEDDGKSIFEDMKKSFFEKNTREEKTDQTNYITKNDFVDDLIDRHNFEIESTLNMLKIIQKFNIERDNFFLNEKERGNKYRTQTIEYKVLGEKFDYYSTESFEEIRLKILKTMRRKYWSILFSSDKISSKLTNKKKG